MVIQEGMQVFLQKCIECIPIVKRANCVHWTSFWNKKLYDTERQKKICIEKKLLKKTVRITCDSKFSYQSRENFLNNVNDPNYFHGITLKIINKYPNSFIKNFKLHRMTFWKNSKNIFFLYSRYVSFLYILC